MLSTNLRPSPHLHCTASARGDPGRNIRIMEKHAKEALQVTKEIVVKFIEAGRASPANFADLFPEIYRVVLETVTKPGSASGERTGSTGKDSKL